MAGSLKNGTKSSRHVQIVGTGNQSFSTSFGGSFDSPEGPSVKERKGTAGRKARLYSCSTPFKKKTCSSYFENAKKAGFCCCGREESHHSQEAKQGSGGAWSLKDHVVSKETNARGEVEFHGTNRKTRAKYIRVSNDTDAKDALKLLLKEWKLDYPNFLVSVTGGAKTFKLPVKLKQLFSNGLYKVAQTTGAWVITGGTNTGVMKHVGEALQVASKGQYGSNMDSQKRVYCIGIATWGIVEHRHLLIDSKNTVKYSMTNSIDSAGACLDNNHTHFFLVDNGTVNQYGAEIDFRARLENQIIKMEVDKNRGGVPSILLVLEGGPNTVATVHAALSQDPPVPVVVIKDSGRAADLLAFAHSISHGEGPLYDIGDVAEHKYLLKKIEQTFPELDSSKCLGVYANVLKCVEKKHLITVFRMEEGAADLDQAILTALLKSKSTSQEDQLKLALIWNRPDIARVQIFNEDHKWTLSSLENAMKTALEKGRTEFVELLLDQGVNMASFLDCDKLEALYSARAWKRNSIMRYFLDTDKRDCGSIRMCDVYRIFRQLTGLNLEPVEENQTLGAVLPLGIRNNKRKDFQNPFKELFIWAVLNNMQRMALCFWKRGEEAMAKALVACKLYFAMEKYAERRESKDDIIDTLKRNGEEFQRLAVQLLDVCFVTDEPRASKLLTYELENWGKTTNLGLAVSSEHIQFVAHSCNQELLTDIWSGLMTFKTQKSLKVVICMLLPPFVLSLGFRTRKELRDMPQTESYELFDDFEEDEEEATVHESEEGNCSGDKQRLEGNLPYNVSFDATSHVSIVPASQKDVETNASSDNDTTESLKWWQKLFAFYKAPITKFWGNVLSYLVFLVLFTYVLMGKLYSKPSNSEIVLIIFVISLTTEEIRQILKSDSGSFRKKLYEWSRSKWNLCDGLAISLFYIGLILRLNESTLTAGRCVLAIDIMFWIIRLLDIFSVNQNLGPYVVIIGKMTIDLAYFLFIMAVFLLAYGVARRTLLQPNASFSWKSVAEIFFVPYFQVYGELFIEKEHLFSANTTYFGTKKHSDFSEPVVSLLMAFYLLIANILLLNLLIAIFNNTFAKVQTNSNVIWKFQRYHLILEYARRPLLVPPLVIINHLWSVSRHVYERCRRNKCCGGREKGFKEKSDKKIKFKPSAPEKEEISQYEEGCMIELLRKHEHDISSTRDARLRIMLERIDHVSGKIEETKKETRKREEGIDMKLFHLQHKVEELTKTISEAVSALSQRRDSGILPGQPSLGTKLDQMSDRGRPSYDEERGGSGVGKAIYSAKPIPRRFLSHNPYMHMPQYEKNQKVKTAAWRFRRASLNTPSKEQLMKALGNQTTLDGEDTIDGPAQPYDETAQVSSQNNEQLFRERSISCPSQPSFERDGSADRRDGGSFLENDDAILSEVDETDFDEVDASGVNFDVDSVIECVPSISPSLLKESRISPYPASGVIRFPVPDCFVPWATDYYEYSPQEYTSPMLRLSSWIDSEEPSGLKFNSKDDGVNRISYFSQYDVIDGRPRNPFGRTGLTGRGLLGRWGPNHATEAIITRWKRKPNNDRFERGKFSLEFLALKKKEEFAFPGGLIISMELVPKVVSQIFNLEDVDSQVSFESSEIGEMLAIGFEVSKDFDDSRNTDNAWLETKIVNFHDEDGNITKNLNLVNTDFSWIEVDSDLHMARKRKEFLAKVAEYRGAHF